MQDKGRTMMQERTMRQKLRRPVRWSHGAMRAAFTMTTLLVGLAHTSSAETSTFNAKLAENASISSYTAQPNLSGSMVIAGSDTMQPLMLKLATAFKEWQPTVKTAVQGGGSEVALRQFKENQATIRRGDAKNTGHLVSGNVSLLASSRPLTTEERKDFEFRHGFQPTEIPVAMDAVAIYVHRDNPLPGLTLDQVDAIFGSERKRGFPHAITKWSGLGLENEWGAQSITLYGRDKRSGTRTFFIEEALLGGSPVSQIKESAGSATEILEISRDPLGMGYAGTGFQASAVRAVPVSDKAGEPFVAPTAQSAMDGTYPLARYLYLYTRHSPEQVLEPQVLAFLKFINSREGQQAVARAGYYPLSETVATRNLHLLDGAPLSARAEKTDK